MPGAGFVNVPLTEEDWRRIHADEQIDSGAEEVSD